MERFAESSLCSLAPGLSLGGSRKQTRRSRTASVPTAAPRAERAGRAPRGEGGLSAVPPIPWRMLLLWEGGEVGKGAPAVLASLWGWAGSSSPLPQRLSPAR